MKSEPTRIDGKVFDPSETFYCRIEVRSEVLGNDFFWGGGKEEIESIRNICAREVARCVFSTGRPHKWGMWYGFPVRGEEFTQKDIRAGSNPASTNNGRIVKNEQRIQIPRRVAAEHRYEA